MTRRRETADRAARRRDGSPAMTLEQWLRDAAEDAGRRRPGLIPHLAALAAATRHLRDAAWHREAVPPNRTPRAPEEP